MCAELQAPKVALQAESSWHTLSRIAEIVGVPVQAFYGPVMDGHTNNHLKKEEEARLLAILQNYLHTLGPEDGQRFAGAVWEMTKTSSAQLNF